MSKNPWQAICGPIQFLDDVDMKGEPMRRATIASIGSGKRVRCTVWPQFNDTPLALNDWIFVEGPGEVYEYEDNDGNPKTSYNLSVQRLAVLNFTSGVDTRPQNNTKKSSSKSSGNNQPPF